MSTILELFNDPVLAEESGGTKPELRIVAHVRTGSRRWIAAAAGGYHDGENALADELVGSLAPGMVNLADRGLFSMDRWIRFSATGAHLCWRVKNGARSVPFKMIRTLKDGSELVLPRESSGMLSRRRRDAGDKTLPRLPDTIARLVSFTMLTRTARGRTKTTTIRLLTTLRYWLWTLHARLVRHARARVLKISRTWPWKDAFLACSLGAAMRPQHPPDQPPRPCDPEEAYPGAVGAGAAPSTSGTTATRMEPANQTPRPQPAYHDQ